MSPLAPAPKRLRPLRVLALSGASLLVLTATAAAQQATPPRRGTANPPAEASVQLSEISVETQGNGGGTVAGGGAGVGAAASPAG
ncbi:hypothetical protein, partial [Methylobacterium sp. CCH5-D2]|uniref:hypothetical protein n=1 Tax=Methylobacterium sp. CCH5-D2 TaxID=1768765 RepID=UPI000ADD2226